MIKVKATREQKKPGKAARRGGASTPPDVLPAAGEASSSRPGPVPMAVVTEREVTHIKMNGDPVAAISRIGGDESGERFAWLWKAYRHGRVPSREEAVTAATGVAWSLIEWCQRQWQWSDETFGPGRRTKGIIAHIRKELREVASQPEDLEEWVDIMILAMDGFRRHGGTPMDLVEALDRKQTKNFARRWPDWRKVDDEDVAIEHYRSEEYDK